MMKSGRRPVLCRMRACQLYFDNEFLACAAGCALKWRFGNALQCRQAKNGQDWGKLLHPIYTPKPDRRNSILRVACSLVQPRKALIPGIFDRNPTRSPIDTNYRNMGCHRPEHRCTSMMPVSRCSSFGARRPAVSDQQYRALRRSRLASRQCRAQNSRNTSRPR